MKGKRNMKDEEEKLKKATKRKKMYIFLMIILIVCLIILSYWEIVYRIGNDCSHGGPLADDYFTETQMFNMQFNQYEGERVKGSNVKQLCKEVKENNLYSIDDKEKIIEVRIIKSNETNEVNYNSETDTLVNTKGEFGTEYYNIIKTDTYKVKCNYSENGVIQLITVEKNNK